MSKNRISKEIQKELAKLNDRIDRKIIKGQSFEKDARRHRELLATLRNLSEDVQIARCSFRRIKSPVRKSLAGSPVRRVFGLSFA